VLAAAGKTRDRAAHSADPRELLTAIRTAIDEPRGVSSRGKRQIVTALFVGDPQIKTRPAPLVTVRWNPSAASAKLGKNMRQFVTQSPVDFDGMLD
jgi:hypothetical protein